MSESKRCYLAIVVREVPSDEGKREFFAQCLSGCSETEVDDQLLRQVKERQSMKDPPPYFYRRGEGATYKEAVANVVQKIEEACREEGINIDEVQGLQDL